MESETGLVTRIVVTVAFAILLLIISWIFVRLLRRGMRSLISSTGIADASVPQALVALGVVVWLFPDVLFAIWSIVIAILRTLLIDLPGIAVVSLSKSSCATVEECLEKAVPGFVTGITELGQLLVFRSGLAGLDVVRLVLAAAILAVMLVILRSLSIGSDQSAGQTISRLYGNVKRTVGMIDAATRSSIALTAVITIAAYLAISAVAAVSLFNPGKINEDLTRDRLDKELSTTQVLDQVGKNKFSERFPPEPTYSFAEKLPTEASGYARALASEIDSQGAQIVQSYSELRSNIYSEQDNLKNSALAQYEIRNIGRLPGREQANHYLALTNWYFKAMQSMFGNLHQCLAAARFYRSTAQRVFAQSSRAATDLQIDYFRDIFDARNRVEDTCRPTDWATQLPDRESFGQYLGPVGTAAGWILATESEPIALIIGLVGFGLFGALVSEFVRGGRDAKLKPNLFSVICIGGSAAIVVFLAAYGGIAVVAEVESAPNPYVLFVTCLVGAVFGEDIWQWARERFVPHTNGEGKQEAEPEPQKENNGQPAELG